MVVCVKAKVEIGSEQAVSWDRLCPVSRSDQVVEEQIAWAEWRGLATLATLAGHAIRSGDNISGVFCGAA